MEVVLNNTVFVNNVLSRSSIISEQFHVFLTMLHSQVPTTINFHT